MVIPGAANAKLVPNESVTYLVTIVNGGRDGITVTLVSEQTLLQSASNVTVSPSGLAHIDVNGYRTYPGGVYQYGTPGSGGTA